jgi:hypothetical protein
MNNPGLTAQRARLGVRVSLGQDATLIGVTAGTGAAGAGFGD